MDGIQRKTEADRSMRPAQDIVAQVFSRFTQHGRKKKKLHLKFMKMARKWIKAI